TIAVASCLTYLGNRLLTFGDRPRPDTARSLMMFVLVNLIAAGLQLSCLAFSRYVLGLDSVLADNISGALVGQVVSTSFRYVTYGRLVFPTLGAAGAASSPATARLLPGPATERLLGVITEGDEHDGVDPSRGLLGRLLHGLHRDPRGVVHRPAVDPGGDGREGDGASADLRRHPQALSVAGGEGRGAVLAGGVHGPDGVDHPAGRQPPGGRGDGSARGPAG